jgi:hypothetical protein
MRRRRMSTPLALRCIGPQPCFVPSLPWRPRGQVDLDLTGTKPMQQRNRLAGVLKPARPPAPRRCQCHPLTLARLPGDKKHTARRRKANRAQPACLQSVAELIKGQDSHYLINIIDYSTKVNKIPPAKKKADRKP